MAGNPIQFSDLFDFSNLQGAKDAAQAVRDLRDAYKDFVDVVINGNQQNFSAEYNKLTDAVKALTIATNGLNQATKDGQQALMSMLQEMRSLETSINTVSNAMRNFDQVSKSTLVTITDLVTQMRNLITLQNQVNQNNQTNHSGTNTLSADIQNLANQIKALTSGLQALVTAMNSYNTIINNTQNTQNNVNNTLNQTTNTLNQLNQATVNYSHTVSNTTNVLNTFNTTIINNSNAINNNTNSINTSNSAIVRFAATLFSLQKLLSLLKTAFDEAMNFDAISQSLEFVSGSTKEFEKNLQFLRKTANDLGLDLETVAKGFRNLASATMGTNLEGQRTRDIFLAVSKAASVMKLSNDSVNGVFIALEQIVSKGTVQMEELRKQLGNRMPGAFELFAKGLNLSGAELNKFLREGRITKDALVPFAEQLEKTFGSGVEKSVNSLQASFNRLTNTLKSFFQSEGVLNGFKSFVDLMYAAANGIKNFFLPEAEKAVNKYNEMSENVKHLNDTIFPLLDTYDKLKAKTTLNNQEQQLLRDTMLKVSVATNGAGVEMDKYGVILDINRKKVLDFVAAQNKIFEASRTTAIKDLEKEFKEKQYDIAGRASYFQNKKAAYNDDGTLTPTAQYEAKRIKEDYQRIAEIAKEILQLGGTLNYKIVQTLNQINDETSQRIVKEVDFLNRVNALNVKIKNLKEDIAWVSGSNEPKRQDLTAELRKSEEELRILLNGDETRKDINPFGPGKDKSKKEERDRRKLMEDELRDLKDSAALKDKMYQQEYDNSRKNFTDQVELNEQRINNAQETYEKQIKILEKYHGLVGESETRYKDRKKEAKLTELDVELKSQEALYKIHEEVHKRHFQAEKELDNYIDKLTKARAALDKVRDDIEQGRELSEHKLEYTNTINPIAVISGATGANAAFREKNLERDLDITRKKKDAQKSFEAYSKEEMKGQGADPEKLLNLQTDYEKKGLEVEKAISDKKVAAAQREKEAKEKLMKDTFNMSISLINAEFDARKAAARAEIDIVQSKAAFELNIAGNNTIAKTKIARDEHNMLVSLKRKEAQAEKDQAIFSASLNAAMAIARAFSDYPFVLALGISAIAGAMAAVQISAISSKPLPAYAKGRKGGGEELAIVNEQGAELIESKGKFRIAAGGKETVTKLEQGDIVHTHDETVKMLVGDNETQMNADNFLKNLLDGTGVIVQKETHREERLIQALLHNAPTAKEIGAEFDKVMKKYSQQPNDVYLPSEMARRKHLEQLKRNGL